MYAAAESGFERARDDKTAANVVYINALCNAHTHSHVH